MPNATLDELIAKAEASLDQLETKPTSEKAIREMLTRLDAKIRQAQERGYSLQEIIDLIAAQSPANDAEKLKEQLNAALESKPKKTAGKRIKTRAKKVGMHTSRADITAAQETTS